MDVQGLKLCSTCHQILPVSSFCVRRYSLDGLQRACKPCDNKRRLTALRLAASTQTVFGSLSRLLGSAKQSAKERGAKGREDASVCEITKEDLEKQLEDQEGKCFYSGIDLRADTRMWRVSLERKDPSQGYTINNTVLCCLEFNCRCQWSPDWIRRLVYMVLVKKQGNNDHVELEIFDVAPHERKEYTPQEEKEDANGNWLHWCKHCAELKPRIMFNVYINNGCKACQSKITADIHATPRGVMRGLVGHARASTKNWKKKNDPRGGDSDFELSLDVLIQIYKDQGGRCAYSGLPFDFGTQHQKPSLERKDPLKPYTKDNVCFICMVWNTADHAAHTKDIKPGDHQGWNKEKFEYAFEHILAKVKHEFEDSHGGAPMTMDAFKIQFIAEYESKI